MASSHENPAPTRTASTGNNNLSFARVILSFRKWWRDDVMGTVDQVAVIEKRRAECVMSGRYLFMTAMSAGIAVLGLLLSSPAVVIGAMLLSPLMDPIMGLGFALAIGDYRWLRQSAISLAWGSLLAIILCAAIVFLSPLKTVTPEIAARTSPNLFDLGVAVFSALAGAYAMIRGREGTIVGVAIATALMPPLAVVGFGLATANWTVFSGSLFLYVTNLLAIAAFAALMARLYGFRTSLSERQTQLQNLVIGLTIFGLAIPLGISLIQIADEANANRQIQAEIAERFDNRARVTQFDSNFAGEAIEASATVLTPELVEGVEATSSDALTRRLGRTVNLSITQFQGDTSSRAAEQAELANARAQEEVAAVERARDLGELMALMAGVDQSEVMIDRDRRRAMVKASELDGATLAAYFELEKRISATEPEWKVELIPPAKSLPEVTFSDGQPTEAGSDALKVIAWAAGRVGAPILLSGPAEETEFAQTLLREEGAPLSMTETAAGPEVRASWGSIER